MSSETPETITPELLRSWGLPSSGGDKSERGTVLVAGGARQTPGSVLLAAETALRVGAGKVQIATAADTAASLAVALPEAFVDPLPVLQDGELAVAGADRIVELADAADVVLLGPGLGDPDAANLLLAQVVPRLSGALVLDALGTAYLTGHLDGVRHLAGRVVLTPNVVEAAAMLEREVEEVGEDELGAARELADGSGAVVLTGAEVSYVVAPARGSWSLLSASAGLATAGSGDVKAGAVAGLVARGASPEKAAALAAWAHARAGERLGRDGPGFLARDVVRELPRALALLDDGADGSS